VESGITQVRRIKLARDNGQEKASSSAQTGHLATLVDMASSGKLIRA
jgi:hypothetical protein